MVWWWVKDAVRQQMIFMIMIMMILKFGAKDKDNLTGSIKTYSTLYDVDGFVMKLVISM